MEVWQAVRDSKDAHLIQKVETALVAIQRTLDLYSLTGVAFSFNGGKDSTVLLHLIRIALAQRTDVDPGQAAVGLGGVHTFFFHNDADFEDVTSFTHATNAQYDLNMEVLHGDFKAGLESLLQRTEVRAILLGTRRGDPNAPGQETFCPSSAGWPPFMRVNPILEWTYHDVWAFLRCASLPYCCLYDQGFTSLGSVGNTCRNDALAGEDGTFAPAYMLPDARLERAGRTAPRRNGGCAPEIATGTAGLLIIGDEILSAKVDDLNMRFLCVQLRAAGWCVQRALFVRDDVQAIAAAARELSDAYDAVITAGGLGPTPDDVTMQGIAEALGQQVARHPELERRIRALFGANVTDAHIKMADAPCGSEVVLIDYHLADGTPSPFPLVRCRNVYVLPGVPSLVQQKWRAVEADLAERCKIAPFRSVLLRLRASDETAVAAALEEVDAAFGEGVALGSYPVSGQSDGCELVLTLESKDEAQLEAARAQLLQLLPSNIEVSSEHRDADQALNSPEGAPTVGAGAEAAK